MVNNIMKISVMVLIPVLFFSTSCWAHRHHDAHVHGVANVNIAIDQNIIEVELKSPAINVIGFEHNPQDKEELEHAQQAIKEMENGGNLFIFSPAAKCELVEAKIDTGMELSVKHEKEHHGEGHHHDGDEAHHADIEGAYRFSCANPDKLEQLQVKLFEHFHGLHKVVVQVISAEKQTGAELTQENSSVVL